MFTFYTCNECRNRSGDAHKHPIAERKHSVKALQGPPTHGICVDRRSSSPQLRGRTLPVKWKTAGYLVGGDCNRPVLIWRPREDCALRSQTPHCRAAALPTEL